MPLTAEKHILTYLWFVGHESAGYRDVADRFGITISMLNVLISRVTQFLLQIAPEIIKLPTIEERYATMHHFLEKKRFPGIIGMYT